jgi:hypothetical protein
MAGPLSQYDDLVSRWTLYFIPAFFAFLASVLYLQQLKKKRRREAMERLAISMGFTYCAKPPASTQIPQTKDEEGIHLIWGLRFITRTTAPEGPPQGLEGLPLLSRGRARSSTNLLSGWLDGMEALIFDYQYTVGSGKSQRHYSQTVIALNPGKSLPLFELRPEKIAHKIASLFGSPDIDFNSHPEFSKRYLLRGPDENALRGFFGPLLLNFFASNPEFWSVESNGRRLIVYRAETQHEPPLIPEFARQARQIAGILSSC